MVYMFPYCLLSYSSLNFFVLVLILSRVLLVLFNLNEYVADFVLVELNSTLRQPF